MKSINSSQTWIADLDEIIDSMHVLSELAQKKVLITGSNGLICSAIVDILIRWNETHEEKIGILAVGRDTQKIEKRFAPFSSRKYFSVALYDSEKSDNSLSFDCDYIIHGASNASPNKFVSNPVETMLSNFCGMKYLLDYAKDKKVNRVLFISSSEVYGKKNDSEPFKTDEYGYIDLLNPRNSYAVGKRASETLCASYYTEYGVDSVIVRPGHIYGPTASESDNRVSSAWAYMVSHGENIVMKSDGSQIRSYCYCLDCASAILTVLLKGESVKAYNISNPDSVISIRKMAEILSSVGEVDLMTEIPTDVEKKGFNPMSNSSLDSTELYGLGWRGLFDARRGFSHTVAILKEIT